MLLPLGTLWNTEVLILLRLKKTEQESRIAVFRSCVPVNTEINLVTTCELPYNEQQLPENSETVTIVQRMIIKRKQNLWKNIFE